MKEECLTCAFLGWNCPDQRCNDQEPTQLKLFENDERINGNNKRHNRKNAELREDAEQL